MAQGHKQHSAGEHPETESGRVVLCPSGTEPLVRVMVEAASETAAYRVAERLAEVVRG